MKRCILLRKQIGSRLLILAVLARMSVLPSFAVDQPDPGSEKLPSGARESARVERLSGKAPLIKRSYRPPNYESPMEYFKDVFTRNDRFFVRGHLANIPVVKIEDWKLEVGGDALSKPMSFTMAQLKREFKTVEVAAVLFCAGNRRGLFEPHVPGVQWSYGAMGNARWRGVRLKDVLAKAGIGANAVEVVFNGADKPILDKTPDFVKSLPLSKAMEENTIIAFEMSGKPLPQNQGFPARLVVPGWAGTYWMKELVSVQAVSKPFDGFWMKTAYRIPKGKFPAVQGSWPGQETDANIPITEIIVNSMFTELPEKPSFKAGKSVTLHGLAWDGGHGIEKVDVSTDGGKSWNTAQLGKDYGNYSWRQFSYRFVPGQPGTVALMAKATNQAGQTQSSELVPNAAGYHHNVIEKIDARVE